MNILKRIELLEIDVSRLEKSEAIELNVDALKERITKLESIIESLGYYIPKV
jgi:tetrahydromethanopterin S-methyltransferase subunit B